MRRFGFATRASRINVIDAISPSLPRRTDRLVAAYQEKLGAELYPDAILRATMHAKPGEAP